MASSTVVPWALKPQTTLLLTKVAIVDPDAPDGSTPKLGTLALQNGRFVDPESIQSSEQSVVTVDLAGKFACPGLIDCHVHFIAPPGESDLARTFSMPHDVSLLRQTYYAKQILLRGFTTVRDCCGATLAMKEALADGLFPGPRLFFSGRALSQTGGHGDLRAAHDHTDLCIVGQMEGLGIVCDGVAECARGAREQLRRGADFLKIMAGGGVSSPTDALEHVQYSPQEVQAITGVAKNAGTYATAHAYTPASILNAIDKGCSGIEHGNLLTPEIAQKMADNGIWLTPTLVTYEAMAAKEFSGFLPQALAAKNKVVLEQGLSALQIADQAGVQICFGTDLLGPLTAWQSREFALRAKVLSAKKVLKSATVNAAKMLRKGHELGRLEIGYLADLLILDQNPLDDISILAEPSNHVLAVIKEGRVYQSAIHGLEKDTE